MILGALMGGEIGRLARGTEVDLPDGTALQLVAAGKAARIADAPAEEPKRKRRARPDAAEGE